MTGYGITRSSPKHPPGELLKRGFSVAQSTVAKYWSSDAGLQVREGGPDMIVDPTIGFKLLYGFLYELINRG
jgi:hypothetical protein